MPDTVDSPVITHQPPTPHEALSVSWGASGSHRDTVTPRPLLLPVLFLFLKEKNPGSKKVMPIVLDMQKEKARREDTKSFRGGVIDRVPVPQAPLRAQ